MAGRMARSVARALRSVEISSADDGLVQLVKEYARLLDEAPDPVRAFERLGPRLQSALRELGATPAGRRPAAGGKGTGEPAQSVSEPLSATVRELRTRARARLDRAAGIHTSAA